MTYAKAENTYSLKNLFLRIHCIYFSKSEVVNQIEQFRRLH